MLPVAAAAALSLGLEAQDGPGPQARAELELTPAEREYLTRKPYLRVCADPDYRPFEFIDEQGRHRGISGDLLEAIGHMLDVSMRLVPSTGWTETLELARRGECDLVAMLNETPSRAEFLNFTRPYVTFDNVIVTHRPAYHRGLASLAGHTLALPMDYRISELVATEHPEIRIVTVANGDAALRAVSRGEADATLVNQQRLARDIQRLRLRHLHFAGDAELQDHYRMGVRKDDEMLLAILDRALARIPPSELSRIMERWYVVPVDPAVNWRLILSIGGAVLLVLAFLLLHLYHRRRYYRLLVRQNRELERISGTDALTQAANRRKLDARLSEEIQRARRYRRPLGVIMFDIDRFKAINDERGHQAGDDVLIELVELIRGRQRQTDVFGRWGGDEFLLLCAESDIDECTALAERLRHAVAAHVFRSGIRLTISIGLAACDAADGPDTLLHRADTALYDAKAAGGNRIAVCAGATLGPAAVALHGGDGSG